jgi:hypothetical protein
LNEYDLTFCMVWRNSWEYPTYLVAILPHNSLSLSFSLQYLLRAPNQTPLFITASLRSLSAYYTTPFTEPNNDLHQSKRRKPCDLPLSQTTRPALAKRPFSGPQPLIFCTRSFRYQQIRLRIAILLLSLQVTPLFSAALCSEFTATNIDITGFYVRINVKLIKTVISFSLCHRAYFTYSLLIYPTNALHLKHSLVYV